MNVNRDESRAKGVEVEVRQHVRVRVEPNGALVGVVLGVAAIVGVVAWAVRAML